MQVSLQLLRKFVDLLDISDAEIISTLTMTGLEVEETHDLNQVKGVYCGRIDEIKEHPSADKLKVLEVFLPLDGAKENSVQIVCGAQNYKEGDLVPVATVGAVLTGGYAIKKSRLRGVDSYGMCCSEKELGLAETAPGLFIFPGEEVEPGQDVAELMELQDTLLEISITPNRGDCLSYLGIARELAASLKRELLPWNKSGTLTTLNMAGAPVSITLSSAAGFRYGGMIIRDVQIKPSPLWMQLFLLKSGLRPINNVVDITNYVLLAIGHPMHSFDLDLLQGKIDVRDARKGEIIKALDDNDYKLEEGDLLICDDDRAVALAGVMGGYESQITENSKNLLLEAAVFHPSSIRKTAKRLGLNTGSSFRFERGVDSNNVHNALALCSHLLEKLAAAKPDTGYYDAIAAKHQKHLENPPVIKASLKKITALLGIELSAAECSGFLNRLGLETEYTEDEISCSIPSFRHDLERPVDLIEEIVRLYGFNNVPLTIPQISNTTARPNARRKLEDRVRSSLVALGLHEVVNYSFLAAKYREFYPTAARLLNPLSEEHAYLRTELITSLLQNARTNINRGLKNFALFECGTVFQSSGKEEAQAPVEDLHLGIILTGKPALNWTRQDNFDLSDMVGFISVIGDNLGFPLCFERKTVPIYKKNFSAAISCNGNDLGYVGLLEQSSFLKDLIQRDSYIYAELNLSGMGKGSKKKLFKHYSPFPGLELELSIVIDKKYPAGDIIEQIQQNGGNNLEKVEIYDIYSGDKIKGNEKSYNISLSFRDLNKTLSNEEILPVFDAIIEKLRVNFNARLRES
ncbi:phenylalanine--tRNA ligase subunit beta [Candidatus Riflebacteria bacterium]